MAIGYWLLANLLNEFRQDIVSGDWVLISTERAKKPSLQETSNQGQLYQDKATCPFEDPQRSDHRDPILIYNKGRKIIWEKGIIGEWTTQVVKNKYPALTDGFCVPPRNIGPFLVADGFGFHELVITRDHDKSFAQFTDEETAEVIRAYKDRYNSISQDECGDYVLIFHNHGRLAGASVYHNHSQILSMPIIPPGILKNIKRAKEFFERTGEKVHEMLIEWEVKQNKRIIYENEKFIALCPFVSRTPYETRIFPKEKSPNFGSMQDEDVASLADTLSKVLKKLHAALDNPDYTFFVHTSPIKKDIPDLYDFYHWHIEIMPRFSIAAGMELGTNVFVNTVDPDEAAKLLRETEL